MEVTPVKRTILYKWIEKVLSINGELTAREIAVILHNKGVVAYPIRDSCQPRLTELCKLGRVVVCGSKVDPTTHKRVSVYSLRERNMEDV